MPKQVVLAVFVQFVLAVFTLVLLVQPHSVIKRESVRIKAFAKGLGWLLLSVTFCWSVVVGGLWAIFGPASGLD